MKIKDILQRYIDADGTQAIHQRVTFIAGVIATGCAAAGNPITPDLAHSSGEELDKLVTVVARKII